MAKYFKERLKSQNITSYSAVSDKPAGQDYDKLTPLPREMRNASGDRRQHPSARIDVVNSKEVPLIDNQHGPGYAERVIRTLTRAYVSDSEGAEDAAIEQQRSTPQMFMHQPSKIVGLYADPTMRHTVSNLLGLALSNAGPGVLASDSLSQHSSRLVQRGIDAGLVRGHPRNPDAAKNNDIPMSTKASWVHEGVPGSDFTGEKLTPVSEEELGAGERLMREALRGGSRQSQLSPQFEALQRFEGSRGALYNPGNDPNAVKIPGLED